MNTGTKFLLAVASVLALSATTWMAQAQDGGSATAPTNLLVLPAHSSRASVRSLMKQYERELGVTCGYCHVEDRDSGVIDYASDDNPRKHTARIMIAMLNDINEKHLARLGGDRRYAQPVSCASCHQGRANPPVFDR